MSYNAKLYKIYSVLHLCDKLVTIIWWKLNLIIFKSQPFKCNFKKHRIGKSAFYMQESISVFLFQHKEGKLDCFMFSQYNQASTPPSPKYTVCTEHFVRSMIKPFFFFPGVHFIVLFIAFHWISPSLKDLLREKERLKSQESLKILA